MWENWRWIFYKLCIGLKSFEMLWLKQTKRSYVPVPIFNVSIIETFFIVWQSLGIKFLFSFCPEPCERFQLKVIWGLVQSNGCTEGCWPVAMVYARTIDDLKQAFFSRYGRRFKDNTLWWPKKDVYLYTLSLKKTAFVAKVKE